MTPLRPEGTRWRSDKLSGTVVRGEEGRAISGASVWYEQGGEKIGAATGGDGQFTILWPEGEPEAPIDLHLQHKGESRVTEVSP